MSQFDKLENVLSKMLSPAVALATSLTGNRQDGLEIVQDSLIKASKSQQVPATPTELKSWFFTIVRNGAIDSIRKNKRQEAYERDSQAMTTAVTGPEESLSDAQKTDTVKQAVGLLPFEYRDILMLKDISDLSYEQIATILDIPKGTVMSRLHRARTKFIEIFHELERSPSNRSIEE